MAIEVESKDCTAVTDAELDEMAQLGDESSNAFSMGLLSKQTEEWVLLVAAREKGRLKGYLFTTLERIGGTPAVVIGMGTVIRNSKRTTVLRALMNETMHRALMAFPDEDVLVGARFNDAGGYEMFAALDHCVPRPDHRASGEERAWGRRLGKRFSIPAPSYADREFVVTGDGSQPCVFDHETLKPSEIVTAVSPWFDELDLDRGDHRIAFAWARAEMLEKLH